MCVCYSPVERPLIKASFKAVKIGLVRLRRHASLYLYRELCIDDKNLT